jgi:hypothetical protein
MSFRLILTGSLTLVYAKRKEIKEEIVKILILIIYDIIQKREYKDAELSFENLPE